MDTACTAVITSRNKLTLLAHFKSAIIPNKIGTTAPARAVAEGES